MNIHPLTAACLPGLMAVQRACYSAQFIESADVYRARIASAVQCSLVALDGDRVLAYLAAYRTVFGKVTPLHGAFVTTDAPGDTLYLHDMAVHPCCAGQGLAGALLAALRRNAAAWQPAYSALVSVQNSQGWWQRKGYEPQAVLPKSSAQALASYGMGAVYMARPW